MVPKVPMPIINSTSPQGLKIAPQTGRCCFLRSSHHTLGIQSPSENGFIEPKYHAFRRRLDILIIIWEYDWIPRDHQQNLWIRNLSVRCCWPKKDKNGRFRNPPFGKKIYRTLPWKTNRWEPENPSIWNKINISKLTTNFLGFMLNFGGV